MPELFASYNADCARAVNTDFLLKRMRSTFISYGAPDADFAVQIRNRLRHSGVDVYIFAVDAIPGERLSDLMYQAVNKYDRIIVICTEASLQRAGVRNEIREAFACERETAVPVTSSRSREMTTCSILMKRSLVAFEIGWRQTFARKEMTKAD